MKTNRLDHLSIAVRDLDAARKIWEPVLGKTEPDDSYVDESEKIRVARYWIGEIGFELMESTSPDGDVAKFIEKRGEGIMLMSFNVDSTRDAIKELESKDYPFIGGARPFRDCEFAFIHPKKVNGVLLELIDYKWKELEGKE
jgi:methylmalonyl-CoA/ethylmalonyl-CoA epimerase